ncbi:Glycosyltransferase involved in cell wall bisynthesis [Xylanibacter ruminicola]|uniref:glycosyltransferase family 4 protein n=1 Tax=Xylanibacter ruminicola TaxID=839 RepID=UPI0008E761BB|nr:glycosyltransferase family 4 protein [Xylanibacter ruminicola]SFC56057.1 Glycosyltransferase involved in cell wall bisynthesis [Xylanibacter ruminicola]
MKIQFVTTGYYPHVGGKSSHIETVIRGMRELGHECKMVSYSDIPKWRYMIVILKRIIASPLRLLDFDAYARQSERAIQCEFRKLLGKKLTEWSYDAIMAENPMAAILVSKENKRHSPIVMVMHSYFGRSMGAIRNKRFSVSAEYFKVQKEEHLESLRVIAKLIGVDDRIKEECIELAKEKGHNIPIVAIENFVDTEKYKPTYSEDKRKETKQSYGVETKKVLTCIRRLCDKNGVIYAVDAMNYLPSDFVLLVGGDGECRAEIEEKIIKDHLDDKVKMLGSVNSEKVIELYNISDYVLVPSITVNGLQEATSISALEAMSFKLPVIASSIGGLKQMIEDGNNGLLVEEKDSRSIANAVLRIDKDKDLFRKVSEGGRKDVIDHYSYLVGAQRYLDEIIDVIDNKI